VIQIFQIYIATIKHIAIMDVFILRTHQVLSTILNSLIIKQLQVVLYQFLMQIYFQLEIALSETIKPYFWVVQFILQINKIL
jgi:hypothetical protein